MYNSLYQYTNDIDWFFMCGNLSIHVASNAGLLPNNIYKVIELQTLQIAVENMSEDCDFELNMPALNYYVKQHYENVEISKLNKNYTVEFEPGTDEWVKAYAWSFAKMARRGFYSFDRSLETGLYFLVCKPKRKIETLPEIVNDFIYKFVDRLEDDILLYINNPDSKGIPLVSFINSLEYRKRKRLNMGAGGFSCVSLS